MRPFFWQLVVKAKRMRTLLKHFSYVYAMDPSSLDYSVTSKSSTSDVIANVVDGLLENDKYGNLIPSLAEDWSVSKDGLTYTYKLRKGVKWYTLKEKSMPKSRPKTLLQV